VGLQVPIINLYTNDLGLFCAPKNFLSVLEYRYISNLILTPFWSKRNILIFASQALTAL